MSIDLQAAQLVPGDVILGFVYGERFREETDPYGEPDHQPVRSVTPHVPMYSKGYRPNTKPDGNLVIHAESRVFAGGLHVVKPSQVVRVERAALAQEPTR